MGAKPVLRRGSAEKLIRLLLPAFAPLWYLFVPLRCLNCCQFRVFQREPLDAVIGEIYFDLNIFA